MRRKLLWRVCKGKRRRDGQSARVGILKRSGKVHALPVAGTKSKTLLNAVQSKALLDSIVYTDIYRSYDILDMLGSHHRRVNHCKTFVSRKGHHINGIENFWKLKAVKRSCPSVPCENITASRTKTSRCS